MIAALSILRSDRDPLAKRFSLDAEGTLQKSTGAQLCSGTVAVAHVATITEFAKLLLGLGTHEALAFGRPVRAPARVVTKKKLPEHPGAIARDREHFEFAPGPAILFIDIDIDAAHQCEPFATADDVRAALLAACPALAGAPTLIVASSSSFIVNDATGETLKGAGSWHAYVMIADGRDIPRAGAALYERTWLAGHGCYAVSKSGSLLDRSLIDAAVFEPERLDFAAGANCTLPLIQSRPAPTIYNDSAAPFDSRAIRELDRDEAANVATLRARARAAVAGEAAAARAAYIEARAGELVQARNIPIVAAREIVAAAVDRSVLLGNFELITESGERVTVADMLADPTAWHGRRFADPLEPDYRADGRVAYANLRSGGRPYIFSHAHGGRRFELVSRIRVLHLEPGREAELADDVLEVLRERGDLYDRGRGTARIVDGRAVTVTVDWLADYISRYCRFEKYDGRKQVWRPTRTPPDLARTIAAREGERKLPRLRAVVTAPTMRPDGSVLDRPGYDAASGILYIADDLDPPRVPEAPTIEEVRAGLAELWAPVAQFPWTDDVARGVVLAALLTAAIRAALPTAPGFGFDAPAAGSGKTLIARAVAAMCGVTPTLRPPPDNDDELRKSLFAALRGGEPVLLIDNFVRPIEGAALCGFLTAPTYADRVLGISEIESLENRALFLVTGNNLRAVGDAARRIAIARMDAATERPFMRRFTFDPVQRVEAQRPRLVRAALTILRGYQVLCAEPPAQGSLASFEAWDSTVRQCVAWLAQMNVKPGYADPAQALLASVDSDPSAGVVARVMDAWQAELGERVLTAGEAWSHATNTISSTDLQSAFLEIGGDARHFDARALGRWLTVHRDRIVSGRRFTSRYDTDRKVHRWRLECLA